MQLPMSPSGPNQPTSRRSSSGLALAAQPQRPHSRPLTEPAKAHQNSHLRMHTPAAVCGAGVAPRGGVMPLRGTPESVTLRGQRGRPWPPSWPRLADSGGRVIRSQNWVEGCQIEQRLPSVNWTLAVDHLCPCDGELYFLVRPKPVIGIRCILVFFFSGQIIGYNPCI